MSYGLEKMILSQIPLIAFTEAQASLEAKRKRQLDKITARFRKDIELNALRASNEQLLSQLCMQTDFLKKLSQQLTRSLKRRENVYPIIHTKLQNALKSELVC